MDTYLIKNDEKMQVEQMKSQYQPAQYPPTQFQQPQYAQLQYQPNQYLLQKHYPQPWGVETFEAEENNNEAGILTNSRKQHTNDANLVITGQPYGAAPGH